MIQISKDEAMALRTKYGNDIGITISSRNKKGGRKRYYTEETRRVTYFLERFRSKQLHKIQEKRRSNGV